MERKAPSTSVFSISYAVLNAVSSRPSLVAVGAGTLFIGDGAAVHPQAADMLAALRAKAQPVAVVACGMQAGKLQGLIDAHSLGPFQSLACTSASSAEAAADVLQGLRTQGGANFGDCLLLDSDPAVVRAATRAGLTAQLVRQGLTADALRQGLEAFESRQLDDRGF